MTSVKSIVKKAAPTFIKDAYWQMSAIKERFVGFGYDRRRFLRHYTKGTGGRSTQSHLEGLLVFHTHALEKGLSHQVVRLGFGKSALRSLSVNLKVYLMRGYSKTNKAYLNAISVLGEYIKLHEDAGFEIGYLKTLFSAKILDEAKQDTSGLGGISVIKSIDKTNGAILNFKELFNGRWSVREYSKQPVDKTKIDEVIEIARKTPSICNRQSSRITVIYDQEVISAALDLQGGVKGYALPPALLMITTDTTAFIGANERNQVFIDGGLYAMSILMGLEYVSLAACPLNAMMSVKNDKKMRKLLGIPSSENIIMFISVGNFLDKNKVPRSFRYSAQEISYYV